MVAGSGRGRPSRLGRDDILEGRRHRDMADTSPAIENLLSEKRTFRASDEFRQRALVTDDSLHEQAEADFEGFWAEQARTLRWIEPFSRVLEWDLPFAKWFHDGTL